MEVIFANEESAFTGSLSSDLFLVGLAWADVFFVLLGYLIHTAAGTVRVSIFHLVPDEPCNDVFNYHLVRVEKIPASLSILGDHSLDGSLNSLFVTGFLMHRWSLIT